MHCLATPPEIVNNFFYACAVRLAYIIQLTWPRISSCYEATWHLLREMASKKAEKKSKESKKLRSLALSPPSGGGMPEEARSKLSELFGQIEHQFELLHTENAACELSGRLPMHERRQPRALGRVNSMWYCRKPLSPCALTSHKQTNRL